MGNQTSNPIDSSSSSSSSSHPTSTPTTDDNTSSSISLASVKPDTFILEYREGKLTDHQSYLPSSIVERSTEILQKLRKCIGLFDTKKWNRLHHSTFSLFVLVSSNLSSIDVIGYTLVQAVPVTVPQDRCISTASSFYTSISSVGTETPTIPRTNPEVAAAVEFYIHDMEIFLNYRGRGYATMFLQWLLGTINSTVSSLLPYTVPPKPSFATDKVVVALWGLVPTEETLEFIRNKIMGSRALAAWFVLHCQESLVPMIRTDTDGDNGNEYLSSSLPSVSNVMTGSSSSNSNNNNCTNENQYRDSIYSQKNTFPFPWQPTKDSIVQAIERVQATMNKEASVNNWNIQNLIQQYTEFLRRPFIPTLSASTSSASDSSVSSVVVVGPHFPDEYASAVALLAINEVFNTAASDTEAANNGSDNEAEEEEEEVTEEVGDGKSKDVQASPTIHQPTEGTKVNAVPETSTVTSSIPPPASSPTDNTALGTDYSVLNKRKYDTLNDIVMPPDTLLSAKNNYEDDKRVRTE